MTFGEEFIPIFDDLIYRIIEAFKAMRSKDCAHLMSTTDEVYFVFVQESLHDVWSKSVRDAAVIFSPASDSWLRIRPE